jgi:hypothetical protein
VSADSIILMIRRVQARDDELHDQLEGAVDRHHQVGDRCVLAAVQARSGSLDTARGTLAALRSDRLAIPRTFQWPLAITELAEAAEVADDPDTAAYVLAETGPYSGRIAVCGPCVNRPFDQARAQAALAAGDNAEAESSASRAVAASRKRNTPVYLARELVFLAEARRRLGAPRAEVRTLAAEATTLADRMGARVVSVDIERYRVPT